MIQYSFSTVLMATLCCNIMVIFLFLVFHVKNLLPEFGLKLTGFFLILITVRLLLPIEFLMISHNIIFPPEISRVVALFRQPRFWNSTVSWWNLLEIVWAAGCIGIGLYRIICNYRALHMIKQVSRDSDMRCLSIMHQIQEEFFQASSCNLLSKGARQHLQNITIRIMPASYNPMVCGLRKPCILLPGNLELSDEELYFVLKHEIHHVVHHDIWLKIGMQVLAILYWWNPFCWLLKDYLNRFLEMRIDFSMADNPKQRAAYLSCLLEIVKQSAVKTGNDYSLGIHFCSSDKSILSQRFKILLDTHANEKNRPNRLPRGIAICGMLLLFFCSFLFIFESHYMPPEIQEDTISYDKQNSYFIDNQDGTYDFYINRQYIETVDSLKYFDPTIPIYHSLEDVLQNQEIEAP